MPNPPNPNDPRLNDTDETCEECNALPGENHSFRTAIENKAGSQGPCSAIAAKAEARRAAKKAAKKAT